MANDREKALDLALAQIDKQHGKGSIMRMGEKTTMGIEAIRPGRWHSTSPSAWRPAPRARHEIYGPESSGKSTLAMHVVAEAQRNGGICAYIDAEHAMDPVYAKAIGVDIDQLLISQARHRRTGARDRRHPDPLGRARRGGHRLGGRLTPRAEIEARWATATSASRPA